jgi:PKD repeat protein
VENPVFTYYGYNYYQVSQFVSNGYGLSQSTATIGVCPLAVSFTATPTSGQVPVTVQFTDTSTDQPISWLWNFGDGGTSPLQNPMHTYTTSGEYTVRLDARNNLGKCWNTNEISVSPLTASFTTNQTTGLVPLAVQFTDTSTDKPISWLWNFGDGGTSPLQNPVYTYIKSGTYTANLSAYNGYDKPMSSPNIQITVYSLPAVSFTASPRTGAPGTSVIFSDQSTGYPSPTSWYWDFGDGFTSSYQNPSHQYVSSGLYNVNHSATNSQGTNWMNETAYITIS